MIVIQDMELEFFRGEPDEALSPDKNCLINITPAPSRRDPAQSPGFSSGAGGSVLAGMRK